MVSVEVDYDNYQILDLKRPRASIPEFDNCITFSLASLILKKFNESDSALPAEASPNITCSGTRWKVADPNAELLPGIPFSLTCVV